MAGQFQDVELMTPGGMKEQRTNSLACLQHSCIALSGCDFSEDQRKGLLMKSSLKQAARRVIRISEMRIFAHTLHLPNDNFFKKKKKENNPFNF